jgi:galactose mutarotase-like enzyme
MPQSEKGAGALSDLVFNYPFMLVSTVRLHLNDSQLLVVFEVM